MLTEVVVVAVASAVGVSVVGRTTAERITASSDERSAGTREKSTAAVAAVAGPAAVIATSIVGSTVVREGLLGVLTLVEAPTGDMRLFDRGEETDSFSCKCSEAEDNKE